MPMTTYSEEALRKPNKDVLIGIVLSLQSKIESSSVKVLEESKLLNDKFGKLEADVAIARNANSLLSSRLVDTKAALGKCRSLDCNVEEEDLDACHSFKDKKRVIVKFCPRKD